MRSRLEARWPVYFDLLGLGWVYEAERFELESGTYIPDFWLPELFLRDGYGAWLEVKPPLGPPARMPSLLEARRSPAALKNAASTFAILEASRDVLRCRELAAGSGRPVLIVYGDPKYGHRFIVGDGELRCWSMRRCEGCSVVTAALDCVCSVNLWPDEGELNVPLADQYMGEIAFANQAGLLAARRNVFA